MLGDPAARFAYGLCLAAADRHRSAVPQFARAAHAGLPAAQFHLGRCYLLGLGVPSCVSVALRWLTRAADQDSIEAQALLASLALQGITDAPADGGKNTGLFALAGRQAERPSDHKTALHWATRAAAGGSAEAQVVLGYILTTGPPELRDLARGIACYRQAAEAGSTQGKLGWAFSLLRDDAAGHQAHARALLRDVADAGGAAAHYTLGLLDDSPGSTEDTQAEAAAHYRAGAALGHRGAQFRYGVALLAGRGVPRDPQDGKSWLRRAALGGERGAAVIVGDLYARVGLLPPNYCEAGIWFQRAADGGHPGAARALGQLYLRGDGFGADPPTAVRWLRIAAEAGDLEAAYDLGLCVMRGLGATRDDIEALHWLRTAAAQLPNAQYWYARMLAEGRGAPEDLPSARAWFLRAAEAGNGDAAIAAAEMLLNGRGGPADPSAAIAMFTRTAAAGHPGGRRALELLESRREAVAV